MLNESASVSSSTAGGAKRNVIGIADGANSIDCLCSDNGANGNGETNDNDAICTKCKSDDD
eukprot:13835102-Ditylum_brightwellii.AAC.1